MKDFFGKFIESGLVAAVVMAIAYLLTCFDIWGSLAAYNLPSDLIEIGIPDIIMALYEVVINVWMVLPLAIVIALISHYLHDKTLLNNLLYTGFLLGIIIFCYFTVHYFDWSNWILIGIIAYIWISSFVTALVKQRHVKGSFRDKWKANTEAEASTEAKDRGKSISHQIAVICLVICALYYTSQAMFVYGEEDALDRTSYYVAHDYDDKVVVFQSEWSYILMENDNGSLQPNYQIVRFDELGSLSYEYTGKLTVSKPS